MYGYGNVSNHLSFVPSSGKSASKGFDTCERNHTAPMIKESRETPGAARSRRGAQLQESSRETPGAARYAPGALSPPNAPGPPSRARPAHPASRRSRSWPRPEPENSKEPEPERRAGAQSRSHCAETRRVLPLCWAGQRHAAVTVLSVCSQAFKRTAEGAAELDELGMPRLRDRRAATSQKRVGELFESHKWLLCKESFLGAMEGRYPLGVTAGVTRKPNYTIADTVELTLDERRMAKKTN